MGFPIKWTHVAFDELLEQGLRAEPNLPNSTWTLSILKQRFMNKTELTHLVINMNSKNFKGLQIVVSSCNSV